uniref:Uncharacterized protein n=1 Tax=viral metagenome TaxID=1070528 RepID=A0A6C0DP29_9ZZZZ
MPFLGTLEGTFGFGRNAYDASNPILSGNALTSMISTGATIMATITGVDDQTAPLPTDATFNFSFFGSNYGAGATGNNGIYWSTNNVVGFGVPSNTTSWSATTGRGVLLGQYDRRTDAYACYFPIATSGNYKILRFQAWFRNYYSAGVANEGGIEVRLAKNTINGNQYIETRVYKGSGGARSGAIATVGQFNITDQVSYKGTFGSTFASTFPADNTSFVLSSDANGSNWTFSNTSYLNI